MDREELRARRISIWRCHATLEMYRDLLVTIAVGDIIAAAFAFLYLTGVIH